MLADWGLFLIGISLLGLTIFCWRASAQYKPVETDKHDTMMIDKLISQVTYLELVLDDIAKAKVDSTSYDRVYDLQKRAKKALNASRSRKWDNWDI